ncbi:MAG: shikimate dehydrogenase [Candidatus Latescibacteria bacterium]|nr:shikimate dehydrogenase [Candidatus Latescibacterota bacterium]
MEIDGRTTIVGVIGYPIAHSLSPRIHNAAIQAWGINWCYLPFQVAPEDLEKAIEGMRGLGIRGLNITVPHKQAVMRFLDWVSPEASAIGAVNTILNEGGRLSGYNTDVEGILAALRFGAGLERLPEKVVVLGAGGAARGIVYALATVTDVKHITILNRTIPKAERLAAEMEKMAKEKTEIEGKGLDGETVRAELREAGPAGCETTHRAGLVINATPVGMYPNVDCSPIEDPSVFHPGLVLYDTIYNPEETKLMRLARSQGAKCFNGLDMLVYQGAKSLEIWTGKKVPVEVMKKAVTS